KPRCDRDPEIRERARSVGSFGTTRTGPPRSYTALRLSKVFREAYMPRSAERTSPGQELPIGRFGKSACAHELGHPGFGLELLRIAGATDRSHLHIVWTDFLADITAKGPTLGLTPHRVRVLAASLDGGIRVAEARVDLIRHQGTRGAGVHA